MTVKFIGGECDFGKPEIILNVPIPANLSHTGKFHWALKPVDRCIAPIVQALNDGKIYTAGCCCGHGETEESIVLHDGRMLIIKNGKCARGDKNEQKI